LYDIDRPLIGDNVLPDIQNHNVSKHVLYVVTYVVLPNIVN
jgi:hypothetical protein